MLNLLLQSARTAVARTRPLAVARAGSAPGVLRRGVSGLPKAAPASGARRAVVQREPHLLLKQLHNNARALGTAAAAAETDAGTPASALNTAVALGDLKAAKTLVARGANVNVGDYDGRTPLHVAASCNNVEMARWLVAEGAVMREDRDSRLPIHDTIQHRNSDMAAVLESCPYVHEHDFSETFNPDLVRTVFERAARHGLFTVDSLDKKLRCVRRAESLPCSLISCCHIRRRRLTECPAVALHTPRAHPLTRHAKMARYCHDSQRGVGRWRVLVTVAVTVTTATTLGTLWATWAWVRTTSSRSRCRRWRSSSTRSPRRASLRARRATRTTFAWSRRARTTA